MKLKSIIWILGLMLASACATGDLDGEDQGNNNVRPTPDEGMSDLPGVVDMALPDIPVDLTDMTTSDMAADMNNDAGTGDCQPTCGAAEVCRDTNCLDICEENSASCGNATLDGKTAFCGGCNTAAGQGCLDGMCQDICAIAGSQCGDTFWDGQTVDCGGCTAPAGCYNHICAQPGYREVAAGFEHTCAVRSNGQVRCWGDNTFGQLGTGGMAASLVPVNVTGVFGIDQVGALNQHVCASKSSGAWCWGLNSLNQIGDGTQVTRTSPQLVSNLPSVADVGAGGGHSCAVLANGNVSCWGGNGQGQLGLGTFDPSRSTPVEVPGFQDGVLVDLGTVHTCALKSDGTVWCWGFNDKGQISGAASASNRPQMVAGLTNMTDLAVGGKHTCAIQQGGDVWCWGDGGAGQLGRGSLASSNIPVQAGINNVVKLAAGRAHTCALNASRELYCWGDNANGQVGDGSTQNGTSPTQISLANVLSVGAGQEHTCASTTDGRVWCWGLNTKGQLGDNSTSNRLSPVLVE